MVCAEGPPAVQVSVATLRELDVRSDTVTPFWHQYLVLLKVPDALPPLRVRAGAVTSVLLSFQATHAQREPQAPLLTCADAAEHRIQGTQPLA